MSPTVNHIAPTGDKDEPVVLGDVTNGTSAQPLTKGDETKPCVGESLTKSSPKDDESSKDRGKLQTMNERFQFDPEKPRKKKKKGGFMKRGPTALVKNRGTGFEGKVIQRDCLFGYQPDHTLTDFYCDPPMTPAEVEEEKNDIYPP
jgi:hypothetical protein